jgi:HK97 family phage portal protein
MKLFKRQKKKEQIPVTKASVTSRSVQGFDFDLFGFTLANKMQWREISNLIAWKYYMQVSVIYNAVDLISQSFAIIPPRIWDEAEQRFLTNEDKDLDVYELLVLLEEPRFGTTYKEFAKQQVPNYLVTGDLFLVGKAINDSRPLTELNIINSQNVTIDEIDREGYATSYTANYQEFSTQFQRDPKSGRFYNRNRMIELWHTQIFNPLDKNRGLSPLNPLFYEIEQFIASAIHNGNLLKQGARPSGVLTLDPEVDLKDEAYQSLDKKIKEFYRGAENAGNVLILQNGKEFKELSVSNKDMDFSTLKETTVEQMYRNLKIPMSLVMTKSMTLDNFKLALPVLYNMAVLPLADILFEEMNLFLMHRYDDTGRYVLTYNPRDIKAIQVEFNAEVDRQIKTGVLTFNEARQLLDKLPLEGETGNQIFQPLNLVPIGTVEQAQKMSKEEYSDLLRKNNFTEEQIVDYISKFYGK